jgi:cytochrome c biogenesis protein CcdA
MSVKPKAVESHVMHRPPVDSSLAIRREEAVRMSKYTLLSMVCIFAFPWIAVGQTADRAPLTVYLFASSTCSECAEIKAELFPKLRERYAGAVQFVYLPVDDVEAFKLQLLYEKRYGIDDDEALKVFVGGQCLSGKEAILAGLDRAITEELAKGAVTPTPEEVRGGTAASKAVATAPDPCADDLARSRFLDFKPGIIALAGLIDGVNPCAFTTLIFFISLLTSLGKKRREVLTVGLCFAAAVFLTYMALGLGILKTIKVVSVNTGIARGLTFGVAGLTLIFAGYSFLDWRRYRRSGKSSDISLKLPDKIRNKVRTLISRQMRTRNLVIGALILGVVISLLEAVCTGQVYVPTIMCVSRDPDLAGKAVAYLLLYNSMFIVPLLGVFGIALWGVSSEQMAAFSRKHTALTKLLLGILFLGLAVMLAATAV